MVNLTKRQEEILNGLIKEYIKTTKPVSSEVLKRVTSLDVCGATIRNELQVLTKKGYIVQPHTSAGRVPTKKAYQYFADKIARQGEKFFTDFVVRQIEIARQHLERETKFLLEIAEALEISHHLDSEKLFKALTVLGPTKEICEENENIINQLLKELENL